MLGVKSNDGPGSYRKAFTVGCFILFESCPVATVNPTSSRRYKVRRYLISFVEMDVISRVTRGMIQRKRHMGSSLPPLTHWSSFLYSPF